MRLHTPRNYGVVLYASLYEVSRQTARHNGTSRHLDGAARPSFVPDVRECHPLLRPPFGIGRLSGVKAREWRATVRSIERPPLDPCQHVGQHWNARIYSRAFRGVVAGRFLSSESTAPPPSTIGIFPSFYSSTYAILPLNFSSLGVKIIFVL